jgi:hypothetical protein
MTRSQIVLAAVLVALALAALFVDSLLEARGRSLAVRLELRHQPKSHLPRIPGSQGWRLHNGMQPDLATGKFAGKRGGA